MREVVKKAGCSINPGVKVVSFPKNGGKKEKNRRKAIFGLA